MSGKFRTGEVSLSQDRSYYGNFGEVRRVCVRKVQVKPC
jgi:hypothetical protein